MFQNVVSETLYHNSKHQPIKKYFQNSQDDEILKEAENYIQSSRTVRFDDDSDDDKDAEAITKALEKRLQDKYEKNAIKSAEQRGSEEEDEDEEEEEDSDEEEEEPILPATGVSSNNFITIVKKNING